MECGTHLDAWQDDDAIEPELGDAEEAVAEDDPTLVVTACEDRDIAEYVQRIFMNEYFRVYTSYDVVGVELGGALKNIYAIAAGIVDGCGMGDNSKAAMMTRAIAEMSRLGKVLGGKKETFSGLSGVGDLIVTCTSKHSRNRFVGEGVDEADGLHIYFYEIGGQTDA